MLVNGVYPGLWYSRGFLVILLGVMKCSSGRRKAITNIHLWTTTFIAYMSVYLEKCPGKALNMRRCMYDIRLTASKVGHDDSLSMTSNIASVTSLNR